jgi:hypothetical protein
VMGRPASVAGPAPQDQGRMGTLAVSPMIA